ncbi:vertnin [Chiloscyllium plagiosum]|uniref:vertnin n=1 Tax=Chiloscyllium plagiosum TaxID=36176 RepID=UPI001CB7DEE4|nr:vertnin [Chiloscyllium plagiosum]
MPQRSELIEALHCKLQEATECAEFDFLRAVTVDVDKLLSSLPVPLLSRRTLPPETELDTKARALYPEDAPAGMVPLACVGEGNHLFEAASMLLKGDTSLSTELQLRTMVEMVLHKQYYLKGMIDSKVMLQAARYSLCTEESAEKMNLPMDILEAIFDADVKATCFPGTFANMWHVYALASVLQSDVYSIYPMSNLKIRPYFNRLIRPRSRAPGSELRTLHIMWAGEPLSQAVFKPQYFAPVVPAQELRGQEAGETLLPLKTLELLNAEPDISYSMLREKYSITKSTFYRWKKQSRERRRKAATRYEAKHYLQESFSGGNFLPLQQFRSHFPEISRSTYYAWKHEMLTAGTGPGGGHRPGRERGFDQGSELGRGDRKPLPPKALQSESVDLSKAACGSGLAPFNGQRSPSKQLAKRFLRECVLLNMCPPYKSFKKTYPWVSRSSYYNWRREAISHLDTRSTLPHSGLHWALPAQRREIGAPGLVPSVRGEVERSGRVGISSLHAGVMAAGKASYWQKVRPGEAKKRAQMWQIPLSTFRVRYPSISALTFLWWRSSSAFRRAKLKVSHPQKEGISVETKEGVERAQSQSEEGVLSPGGVTVSDCAIPREQVKHPLVVGTLHGAASKAKAKLFLQRRYISKNFPTFREFSSYFPLTPRSTYYMWKRALSNGMMLMDC